MIRTFADRYSEEIWRTGQTQGTVPAAASRRKLAMLDQAEQLADLRSPPGNRLEKLRGDRDGQYSMRINRQYRICFQWHGKDAYEVQICDYH